MVVHDGSYMPKISQTVCAATFVLHCPLQEKYAHGTWVEKTTRKDADNYRAEILGGVGAQLVVKAALQDRSPSHCMEPRYGCDNLGVVSHGNQPRRSMLERQAQADILRIFKRLISSSPVGGRMYHIYGHLDEVLREDQMTIEEKTNCMADRLATEALVEGVASESYISDNFLFEDTCLYIKGRRVTGSPKKAINNFWSEKVAIKLFHERRIVSKYDFHLIYWDGMEPALRPFSEMFQVWVTKHVSHFCGTNRQLSRWDTSIANVCPATGGIAHGHRSYGTSP